MAPMELVQDPNLLAQLNAPAPGENIPGMPRAGSDLRGEEYLQGLDPATRGIVKAISEYRVPASGRNLQHFIPMAAQYDPSFDQTKYPVALQTRKSFAAGGKDWQNIQRYGTAIGHAQRLYDAVDALGNSTILPDYINPALKTIRRNIGDEKYQGAVSHFDTAKTALASELGAAFRAQGLALHDITEWEKRLVSTRSPVELKSAIGEAMNLLGERMDTTVAGWNQTFPKEERTVEDVLRMVKRENGGDKIIQTYRKLKGEPEEPRAPGAPAPRAAAPAAPALGATAAPIGEGTVAVNPQTGERVILRGGRWVPQGAMIQQ